MTVPSRSVSRYFRPAEAFPQKPARRPGHPGHFVPGATAQMLDWFKHASPGPSSNAGIWHLYKRADRVAQTVIGDGEDVGPPATAVKSAAARSAAGRAGWCATCVAEAYDSSMRCCRMSAFCSFAESRSIKLIGRAGMLATRSHCRAPAVNAFGKAYGLNWASNELHYDKADCPTRRHRD